ncbi:exonuclease subunit SbcD [Oceanobacter sp. 5_MG-2023]|uniref:exonuclease subunit SbcD n=1 Tax=Oceanobacter sp. 5_MG-2023 TaxID=3062645 RepID=UPI0026E45F5A|nr:exonuclease subunit SbcD [Oceanobacter sp. 5_MG-2023]MDO6680733.1 exonuclease subunit SbcD [Oceanobacter sp. 5_MG-2023]
MKILHTSDWHLGQSFFTKSRKAEHQAFLDWLLTQVRRYNIDAVIVAGDVFDTGTPPSYAREMYNRFIVAISQCHCRLVILAGNHDSVSTLNESRQLVACLDTQVVASISPLDPHEQLIELEYRHGSEREHGDAAGPVGAIVCAIPFIRPRDVLQSRAGESGLEKRQALGEAIQQHYQRVYQAALALKTSKQLDVPIIATGHLTALGVSQSDSVRDIYIGSLDGFAADGFPPADYIALGHIHRPQRVAKSEHIRYSGSPIPLSFDELKTTKQVVMVEFSGSHTVAITPVDVPVFQPMAVIKGDLAAIEQGLLAYQHIPADQPVWLCIEVEQQDYLADLPQRIQALTEGLAVEVLQLRRSRLRGRQVLTRQAQETLAELTPAEVFGKRLALENLDDQPGRQARIEVQFQQILAEIEHPEHDA